MDDSWPPSELLPHVYTSRARLEGVKWLAHGRVTSKWQSRGLNQGPCDSVAHTRATKTGRLQHTCALRVCNLTHVPVLTLHTRCTHTLLSDPKPDRVWTGSEKPCEACQILGL